MLSCRAQSTGRVHSIVNNPSYSPNAPSSLACCLTCRSLVCLLALCVFRSPKSRLLQSSGRLSSILLEANNVFMLYSVSWYLLHTPCCAGGVD